jgi:hypothetical protein
VLQPPTWGVPILVDFYECMVYSGTILFPGRAALKGMLPVEFPLKEASSSGNNTVLHAGVSWAMKSAARTEKCNICYHEMKLLLYIPGRTDRNKPEVPRILTDSQWCAQVQISA